MIYVINFERIGDPFLFTIIKQYVTMPAFSELKEIIIRLQKALDEELENIRDFKNKCAQDHEFEKAAKVRDLEKGMIAFRESLGC